MGGGGGEVEAVGVGGVPVGYSWHDDEHLPISCVTPIYDINT